MSKKAVIILLVIVLIAAVAGGTLLFLFKSSNINMMTGIGSNEDQNLAINDSSSSVLDSDTSGINVYNDDSGFSFRYPSDFVVSDITPTNDNSYYSLLEVKKNNDVIRVSVKDGSYKTPSGAVVVVTTPSATSASASATLKLGDFKPKQYTYDDSGTMKTLTVASSQGVSYAIDGVTTNDSERAIYNSVVASFLLGKQTTPSSSNSANTVDEGTEVVQ